MLKNWSYLDVIDQTRYLIGTFAAFGIFFHKIAPRKNNFAFRMGLGFIIAMFLTYLYIPITSYFEHEKSMYIFAVVGAVYWLVMPFFIVSIWYFCYEMSFGYALFRGIMALAIECMVTTILRYLIIMMWFPQLPETHTFLYIFLSIIVYICIYSAAYFGFAKKTRSERADAVFQGKKTVWVYLIFIVIFCLLNDVSHGICEWLITPMKEYMMSEYVVKLIQYYGILVLGLQSIIVLVIQYYVYEVAVLQHEKEIFGHLLAEKETQYSKSRENINLINQKCHELKRQILALERADEKERERLMEQTKQDLMFYDAVVKTNNEVLNTILTEKSLFCVENKIRLTCMVNAEHLSVIEPIDLYTMLENAVENAIECVEKFENPKKKAIAVTISEHGKMLYFSFENYYEEEILIKDGFPISKKKKKNHGLGLKGIKAIAKKYNGDIRIFTDDNIFILQITIPF